MDLFWSQVSLRKNAKVFAKFCFNLFCGKMIIFREIRNAKILQKKNFLYRTFIKVKEEKFLIMIQGVPINVEIE